jgi:hypothetical protein
MNSDGWDASAAWAYQVHRLWCTQEPAGGTGDRATVLPVESKRAGRHAADSICVALKGDGPRYVSAGTHGGGLPGLRRAAVPLS